MSTDTLVRDRAPRTASARGYVVAVRPIEFFRPSEEVDAGHVRRLAQEVLRSGHWLAPLPVEADSGLVQLLPDEQVPSFASYFVYPAELKNSARVHVFRDFLLTKAQSWSY